LRSNIPVADIYRKLPRV